MFRRNWVLRSSLVINILVLFYFGIYTASQNGSLSFIREMQKSGQSLANLEFASQVGGSGLSSGGVGSGGGGASSGSTKNTELFQENVELGEGVAGIGPSSSDTSMSLDLVSSQNVANFALQSVEANSPRAGGGTSTTSSTPVINSFVDRRFVPKSIPTLETSSIDRDLVSHVNSHNSTILSKSNLSNVIPCVDKKAEFSIQQRGDKMWVLYNYIIAQKSFHCWESITYTSHSDYTFLDNLVPLLERWQGPVSMALYTPGTDFENSLKTIKYLRDCTTPLVKELVTWHVFFPERHLPAHIPKPNELFKTATNCSVLPPWANATASSTYKSQKKLLYAVNVGRNIAREMARTHYILASDIELYPSPGVIKDFLEMVRRQDPPLKRKKPKVFPLSIFEVESNISPPVDKKGLLALLKNGSAIPFHKKVCAGCHNVPKSKEWLKAPMTPGLHVFHIGKRLGYHVHWEPIYIGTNQEPFYDERLSWEGKSDKMTQGYVMCVMDYEFQILDNAFLVHKPGIKKFKQDQARAVLASKTNRLIQKTIVPELRVLYGTRKGCAI